MQLISVSKKNIVIGQPTILVDWQKQIQTTSIAVKAGQSLQYFFIQGLGNDQPRDITITLAEKSTANVYGLIAGNGQKKLQTNFIVRHSSPTTRSHVNIRGVFADRSQGIINGTIHIAKNGQQADARLEERVLLLSPHARAETIPNLEIETHDVVASHAATVSKISEDEIFYLQTRGISREQSVRTIVNAFLRSQLALLPESTIRARLEAILYIKLETVNI